MRVLIIHAKEFSYRVVKPALKEGYEEPGPRREGSARNALVVFTTVEDEDAKNLSDVVKRAASDILDLARKVKAEVVVIYPYAHLSPRLAPPKIAFKALEMLEAEVSTSNMPVLRAPFGWYKEFNLHCYGHPLSELSRTYHPSLTPSARLEREYYIVTPEGDVYKPEEFLDKADKEFRILIEKEALGKELGEKENPVLRFCEKFGFEWEPLSDYGHMRYHPHAALMVEAVSEYAWILARRLGIPVLKVRGTNMFDLSAQPIYEHAQLYGDRLYDFWAEKKHLVLRYAACFQQFSMLRDYVLSYENLPLGMFEVADSYRFEQSGEVTLCFRLRKFHMPDLHILTRDLEEAMTVSEKLQKLIHEEAAKLGQKYHAIYNVTKDFWRDEFSKLVELIRRDGRPALVTIYPEGVYYWVVNVEYHIIDAGGRPREIATYQFDVGNAKRFNIKYVDRDGTEKYPVIIHTAIIGSVERYIYMVLDSAAKMERRGETPFIPTWLAPIQVRLIPLHPAGEEMKFCEEVANLLEENQVRVDIDDRNLSLGRRVRDAAREWIPYIGVVGDRELATGTINVTIRRTNDRRAMTPEELLKVVSNEVKGYPKVSSTLPRHVSKRPPLVYLEKLTPQHR